MSNTNTDNLIVIASAMKSFNGKPCWVQVLDDASGVDPAIAISNDDDGRTIPFITFTKIEMENEIEEDKAELPEDLFRAVYVSFDNHIINVLNEIDGSISYSYDWTIGRI